MKDLAKRTDEELVKAFISGCNEAFDELLARYQDRLYSYITYIVRNKDVADDLFQETFVKAITTLRQGRYRETGKFYAWLTRIAHNLLIDQFRTERSEPMLYDEEAQDAWRELAYLAEASRESEMVNEQILDDVQLLMESLPANQREVVFMRYYQDLSFKEISEITGVSINTALGRMRYALLNMRRMADEHQLALCAG